MDAGRLDKRLQFERPAPSQDGAGGYTDGWHPEFDCAASYRRLRGGETVQAERLAGNQPTVITIRASVNSAQITTDWRARDVRSGEMFNLRSKVLTDDRAFYEITAESGVAV